MGLWSRIKGAFAPAPPPPPEQPPPETQTTIEPPAPEVEAPADDDDVEDEDDELPLDYDDPIARDRDLEAAIAADPSAVEPYLVYADWLQERGDPRGELIAVQHAQYKATDVAEHEELSERIDALIAQHRAYLAGPAKHHGFDVEYHLGFVRTLSMWSSEESPKLEKMLAIDHPALALLRRVVVPESCVEEVQAVLDDLGRPGITVVDDGERQFEPDEVRKVTAGIELEEEAGAVAIGVEVDYRPFSSALGYSYIARTAFGDDTWWHGSGHELTEEILCDDPMKSGTARVAPLDEPRALQLEIRARIPQDDATHTMWFRGARSVSSDSDSLLLVRCAPCTGAPFDVPPPATASPRLGPVLLPPNENQSSFDRERNAALPGLGVYTGDMLHREGGASPVPAHAPRGDCYFKSSYGGANGALVLVHHKRGKELGSWLTMTRAGELRAQIDAGGSVYGGAVDPSGRWFASLSFAQKSRLDVFEIDTGKRLGGLDVPESELQAYNVGWHGGTALAITDGAVGCLDVATGTTSEVATPKMIGFGWRQYGAGVPTYHPGLGRSAWMMCAEFPDPDVGDETGTTIISWRDRGGPYGMVVVPDHGWAIDSQFATVTILDDGRIVGIGSRVWVVDPETRVATDYGEAGLYPATPVLATVDGRVRLYQHGGGPSYMEL